MIFLANLFISSGIEGFKMSVKKSEPVKIDSRKFLSIINDSAQSKIAFFEDRVKEIGKSLSKDYRLAALQPSDLVFEDVNSNEYFIANHSKNNGRIEISNIRPVEIYDNEKKQLYFESCLKLVNAIEENDQKEMGNAFSRMKAQRFSSRIIPEHGYVVGRDGISRKVNVVEGATIAAKVKRQIVEAVVDSLRDKVVVENNTVVSAYFNDGEPVNLPVTKWAGRKLIAKNMRETAKDAYLSPGFQNRIAKIAKQITEGKVAGAVSFIKPFLLENEEFTLLTKKELHKLVESTLATKAVFNQQLCEDVATLVYRTNLKVNRDTILNEWMRIGKFCEHPTLIENVHKLEESRKFEASYDCFLQMLFEAISNREVAAEALATTLDSLKTRTPRISESNDLSSKLASLVSRLRSKNVDDNAINEAEDLIATIQEELSAQDTLQDYDSMPGAQEAQEAQGAQEPAAPPAPQAPVITINSPLISIGGQPVGQAGGDQDLAGLGLDDMGAEAAIPDLGAAPAAGAPPATDDFEMPPASPQAAPAAQPAQAPAQAGQAPARPGMPRSQPRQPGLPESRNRFGSALNESRPVHPEMQATGKRKPKRGGDHPEQLAEDRYFYADDVSIEGLNAYGNQTIPEDRVALVSNYMKGIKEGSEAHRLVKACRKAGVMVSESDIGSAIEQVHDYDHSTESDSKNADHDVMAEIDAIHHEIDSMHDRIDSIEDDSDEVDSEVGGLEDDESMMDSEVGGFEDEESMIDSEESEDEESTIDSEIEELEDEESTIDSEIEELEDDNDDELPEPEEGMAESQFKFPTAKKKRGMKSYAPRDNKRGPVAEGAIKWLKKQSDAVLGEARGVKFILDHGNHDPDFLPALLSEDGEIQIPMPKQLHEDAYALADRNQVSHRLHQYILRNVTVLRPISESEDTEINQTVAEIQRNADGGLSINVTDPSITVHNSGSEMAPVDGVAAELPAPDEATDDSMPDFGGNELDELEEEGEDEEMEEDEEEGEDEKMEEDEEEGEDEEMEEDEDEEEDEGVAEDNDITSPAHNSYKGLLNQDPRQDVEVKMPHKNKGDQEEGFGGTRSLKKIDKKGNTPNVKFEE
jgi:hypothetical protein